jgi:hypothetical protein
LTARLVHSDRRGNQEDHDGQVQQEEEKLRRRRRSQENEARCQCCDEACEVGAGRRKEEVGEEEDRQAQVCRPQGRRSQERCEAHRQAQERCQEGRAKEGRAEKDRKEAREGARRRKASCRTCCRARTEAGRAAADASGCTSADASRRAAGGTPGCATAASSRGARARAVLFTTAPDDSPRGWDIQRSPYAAATGSDLSAGSLGRTAAALHASDAGTRRVGRWRQWGRKEGLTRQEQRKLRRRDERRGAQET